MVHLPVFTNFSDLTPMSLSVQELLCWVFKEGKGSIRAGSSLIQKSLRKAKVTTILAVFKPPWL